MAKLKKLFLSTTMLLGVCAIGGGLTSHAEDSADPTPIEVTENFSFVEEFDYGDGTIDAYGGANNHHIYANNKQGIIDTTLEEMDGLEVLKVKTPTDTSQTGKIQFRGATGGGSSLYNHPGTSMVIKIKFYIDHGREQQFTVWFNANDIGSSRTYTLLRMRDDGTYFQIPGGAWTKSDVLTDRVSKNEWHEAAFIFENNGGLDGTKSQDKMIGYLDGQRIYETNLADNDDFDGKLTEFAYNLPTSSIGADINMYLDYIRIGEYNAPVVNNPNTVEAFTNIPFDLSSLLVGTNNAYLPSITPSYDVAFALKDSGDVLDKTTSGNITTYSLNSTNYMQYSSLTNKFTALVETELTATVTFSDMFAPINFNISVSEYTEPIPVKEIVVSQPDIVKNNSITLGVGEKYDLAQLFSAEPSTATDLNISYDVENKEIAVVLDSTLQALASGTTKLTITATGGGEEVSKEITLNVTKGHYSLLNGYTTEDSCTAGGEEFAGYESSKANGKEFAPVSVVTDPVFGNVIKFTGVGETTNGAAAHLNLHIPASELVANKDYKLTGWVKMENAGAVNKDARVDVKLIMYYQVEDYYKYPDSKEVPYYVSYTAISVGKTGWEHFEMEVPANFDMSAKGYTFAGVKVEIAAWNVQGQIDSYVTHINLVEQDSVRLSDWSLADAEGSAKEEYTLNVGSTLQLNAVPVPSSATVDATYESSDQTIATVDANGLVTILDKAGEVTIKVTVGTTEKTIKLTVTKSAGTISGIEDIEMNINDFNPYEAVGTITVTPVGATSEFDVVVADETVCTADLIGNELWLSNVTVGTTTITITAKDNPEAKLVITVTFTESTVVENKFTLIYDVNGHGEVTQPTEKVTALPTTFPTPTAEGYTFDGWFLDADCTKPATEGATISADTTLYAKWTKETTTEPSVEYTITYVTEHGTTPASVTGNKLPESLPVLTETGYTFGGWFLDADCTQPVTEGATISADTTLYAKWTKNSSGETPTTPTDPEKPTTPSKGLHPGAIAGIVIAVIVTLGLAGGLVFYFLKKKKAPTPNTDQTDKE